MQAKIYSWVPKAIVLFFIFIAAADAWFIYLAESSNRKVLATPKQRSSQVYFKNTKELIFEFKDQDGLPRAADEVKAYIKNSANDDLKMLTMHPVSGMRGRYAADVAALSTGGFQVSIVTENPDTRHLYKIMLAKRAAPNI